MKRIFFLMCVIVFVGLPTSAQKDENNRIENAGKVMVEGGMRHRSAFGDEVCNGVRG